MKTTEAESLEKSWVLHSYNTSPEHFNWWISLFEEFLLVEIQDVKLCRILPIGKLFTAVWNVTLLGIYFSPPSCKGETDVKSDLLILAG